MSKNVPIDIDIFKNGHFDIDILRIVLINIDIDTKTATKKCRFVSLNSPHQCRIVSPQPELLLFGDS